ncbi:hypothetical protein NMY22_g13590 [Coprinellus aureogranulatus]|nr:hypothetical protein NMY22_g13590 [Coprinellus aureogranulatus]
MDVEDASMKSSEDLDDILQEARAGSIPHIRKLKARICVDYAREGLKILEVILSHLKHRSVSGDEEDRPWDVQNTSIVASSLIALLEVTQWLRMQESRTPITIGTSVRLFEAAKDFVPCVVHFLMTAATDWNRLQLFHVTTSIIYHLHRLNPRFLKVLATQRPMLDLAILWWTAVHHGDPIVYPNGKFLGAPIVDEVGDHALELFYQLATENPSGMAEAVLEGTLCDPQHFIKQTASRIRHLPHLNRLENLKHLPEGTVELGNAQYIVLVMDTLVTNEGRLHNLVMSSPYTVNCFMQTLTVMSSTLYNQQSPSSDREVEERVLHLLQPLKLAQHVVNWVLTAPTNVVCGARTLMEAGLFDIMANYIPFVSDEIHTEVETILAALVPYALYPRICGHI